MQVTIRPLQEKDAYASVVWRNDSEVFKYTGNTYSHEILLENEIEWIRKVISNPNDYRCAILADDIYVGNIYLTDICSNCAEYHIFIGNREYWGKGVAKAASSLIIEYGFNSLGLREIYLSVRKQNTSALMLYKSLGFHEYEEIGDSILMKLFNPSL